jgi:hypothetical protein
METGRTLRDLFSFPGFVASAKLKGVFGDPRARVVTLRRRKKRLCVRIAAICAAAATTSSPAAPETFGWPAGFCMLSLIAGVFAARDAAACM